MSQRQFAHGHLVQTLSQGGSDPQQIQARRAGAVAKPVVATMAAIAAYRKFILLGRGRTGSNFLRSLLNSHSGIMVFGELFRFRDSIGWDFPDYDLHYQYPRLIRLMQRSPVRFLKKRVFTKLPKEISAVGFKIFYYHGHNNRARLWSYLSHQKDIMVIHLKRKNTLRRIISEKRAFLTNSWVNETGNEEPNVALHLDVDECAARFVAEARMADEFDALFKAHPCLQLTYEELAADYHQHIRTVQAFLGVEFQDLKPATYKQSGRSLANAVVNYRELKQAFQGTEWDRFFDE
jgi:LPS sulfotransferase NodH